MHSESGRGVRRVSAGRTGVSGFTLVELMVVLIVLGVAAAVVTPALFRTRNDAEVAAQELIRILHRARWAAVEKGAPVLVELDLSTGIYQVRLEVPEGDAGMVVRSGEIELPPGSESAAEAGTARVSFRFEPLGRADGGPVRFRRENGGSIMVVVDPWVGRSYADRQ